MRSSEFLRLNFPVASMFKCPFAMSRSFRFMALTIASRSSFVPVPICVSRAAGPHWAGGALVVVLRPWVASKGLRFLGTSPLVSLPSTLEASPCNVEIELPQRPESWASGSCALLLGLRPKVLLLMVDSLDLLAACEELEREGPAPGMGEAVLEVKGEAEGEAARLPSRLAAALESRSRSSSPAETRRLLRGRSEASGVRWLREECWEALVGFMAGKTGQAAEEEWLQER